MVYGRPEGVGLALSLVVAAGHKARPVLQVDPRQIIGYCFFLAASNSSPLCQPINLGKLAASQPSAKPNRAIAESATKSISG